MIKMSKSRINEFMIDYRIKRSQWKLNEDAGFIILKGRPK